MESEKVKEIKKALEDNKIDHFPYIDGHKCKLLPYADILTYINEIESENKDLQDLCNKTYDDLTKEIDRLEKENKNYYDRLCNCQAYIDNHEKIWGCYTKTTLKQFAERLKEKIVSMKWAREDTNEKFIKQGVTIKAIDETLNEFLKGENNN